MELFKHQVAGVEFLRQNDRVLLADDMGLGKTAQLLTAIDGPTVVVCPAFLIDNWKQEILRFRPDLQSITLRGRNAWVWPKEGQVVLTSPAILPDQFLPPPARSGYSARDKRTVAVNARERLKRERKQFKSNIAKHSDQFAKTTLIVDEAHYYKNPKSRRSRKMRAISKAMRKVYFASGTPMTGGKAMDLWGMLQAGHMEKLAFGSWPRFLHAMNGRETSFGVSFGTPRPEASHMLRNIMLRRMKSEVGIDLPDKLVSWHTVPVATEALVQELGRLGEKYASGGIPTFEEIAKTRAALAKSRIASMLEYVACALEQGQRLIVFSAHKAPIEALRGLERAAIITGDVSQEERMDIVARQSEIDVLGLTIRAAGVGLNLTSFDHALFVDLDYTADNNLQAEDRIYRIGQERCARIVRMTSDHPFDLRVNNVLSSARRKSDAVLGPERRT